MTIVSIKTSFKFDFLKKFQTRTGDTLVLKTHAPNSAHHAIHVNCVLIGLHLQSVRAGYGNGSKTPKVSERGAKNASQTLRDYIAFAFAVWISHQACIDWTRPR